MSGKQVKTPSQSKARPKKQVAHEGAACLCMHDVGRGAYQEAILCAANLIQKWEVPQSQNSQTKNLAQKWVKMFFCHWLEIAHMWAQIGFQGRLFEKKKP